MILTNFAAENVWIKIGDRIAQTMFLWPEKVVFGEVEELDGRTLRGVQGFGSTNKWIFLAPPPPPPQKKKKKEKTKQNKTKKEKKNGLLIWFPSLFYWRKIKSWWKIY